MIKNLFFIFYLTGVLFLSSCSPAVKPDASTNQNFIKINGQNLIALDGKKFFIQGINLGNWLNPEGYMFGFKKTSSARLINQAFCEMVGPDFTNQFWKQFKDNYITRADIRYIRKTGMNTIRMPFHYKLFTDGAAWEKAAFRCRTLGGHLVVITDSEENDFVYNMMHDQMVVWIGASKDMGTWRWCTTSLFEYQNWAPGQPDSGKVMGFKAVMCGDGPWGNETRGHWDDRPGERTNRNETKYNPHSNRNYSGGNNGPTDNYEVTGYVCEWDY